MPPQIISRNTLRMYLAALLPLCKNRIMCGKLQEKIRLVPLYRRKSRLDCRACSSWRCSLPARIHRCAMNVCLKARDPGVPGLDADTVSGSAFKTDPLPASPLATVRPSGQSYCKQNDVGRTYAREHGGRPRPGFPRAFYPPFACCRGRFLRPADHLLVHRQVFSSSAGGGPPGLNARELCASLRSLLVLRLRCGRVVAECFASRTRADRRRRPAGVTLLCPCDTAR